MSKNTLKFISIFLCFLLTLQQTGFAQAASVELNISGHFASLQNTLNPDKFRPLHLRSLSYDGLNNNFKLLLDKGSSRNPKTQEVESTAETLLNYFFVGISLPNDAFWVNFRPDSPDNIIDPFLAQTDIGKIFLEADLQLKKDTANATNPQTLEGKEYWNKLYRKAEELYGNQNITIPTLTRPWIVPDEIIIGELSDSAYIYKATLKVMLEQDYLKDDATYSFKDPRQKQLNDYSSQLIREKILPKLMKDVNNAKRYAPLRQVYYSLILAQWFKARHGRGLSPGLTSLINSKDLTNLQSKIPYSINTYFNAYKENFAQGQYNIREPVYTPYGQVIRSYFSGGIAKNIAPVIPSLGQPTLIDSKGTKITVMPKNELINSNKNNLLVKINSSILGSSPVVGIFDSHEQAYAQITKAIKEGKIPAGLPLILFDQHSDNAKIIYENPRIDDWLTWLKQDRYIGEAFWIYPESGGSFVREDESFFKARGKDFRKMIGDYAESLRGGVVLSFDLDYFASTGALNLPEHSPAQGEVSQKIAEIFSLFTKYNIPVYLINASHSTPLYAKRAYAAEFDKAIQGQEGNLTGKRIDLNNANIPVTTVSSPVGSLAQDISPQGSSSPVGRGVKRWLTIGGMAALMATTLQSDNPYIQDNKNEVKDSVTLATQGNSVVKEALRKLNVEELIKLATQGNKDAVYALGSLATQDNSAAREALRILSIEEIIRLATQGNQDAIDALNYLANCDNPAATEALRTLNIEEIIRLATGGNKDAVHALGSLAERGNSAAREALRTLIIEEIIRLATQGNQDAIDVLNSLSIRGHPAAAEALRTLNIEEIIRLATGGNKDAVYVLNSLANYDNPAAREALKTLNPGKFIELAVQGNKDAVHTLESFASNGNTIAKGALKTLSLEKFMELAVQGNTNLVPILFTLARNDNIAAIGELRNLAVQGNNNAMYCLRDLVFLKNTAVKDVLKTLDPKKFIELFSQGNKEALYFLIASASCGNLAAQESLVNFDLKPFVQQVLNGNLSALETLKELVSTGNLGTLKAFLDLSDNIEKLNNFSYYQIADFVWTAITSRGITVSPEGKFKAAAIFKDSFKKALTHAKFSPGINSPEVMEIVYKSIDLLGTDLVRDASAVIQNKFNRAPQKIIFYLCLPETVFPLVEAYKEISKLNIDLSFSYFIGAAFAEGYIRFAQGMLLSNYETIFSVSRPMGLDRFGAVEGFLKNSGYLSRNYNGFVRDGSSTYTNEAEETYPGGTFKNPKDALVAHGALLLEDRANFLRDVKKLGYDIKTLTRDQIGVGIYLYYCARDPGQYVQKYGPSLIGKIRNGKHGQALFNAQWPQATSELLDKVYGNTLMLPPVSLSRIIPKDQNTSSSPVSSEEPLLFTKLQQSSSSPVKPGGIDFRFLPIVTQSMDNLRVSIRSMPRSSLQDINLTREWFDIERLVNSGIPLSAERLKEYFAASYYKNNLDNDMGKIISCISDILRQEEESCCLTDPILKDMLVVLGAARSGKELKLA